MELILVRHALPHRAVGDDGRPADPGLQEKGHRQAQAVADWLAHPHEGPIHALYVSPMRRARETAEPIARALALAARIDDDLAEWDRHAAEYVPVEELRAAKDERWFALLRGSAELGVDPGEFQQKVVGAMERIIASHRGQRVAVVCHGGVITSYVNSVVGVDRPVGFFHPEYTHITRVMAASSGERNLHSLNETAHLRGGLAGGA